MEKFLEGEELSDEEILSVVKKGTSSGQLIPVLCGSTSKNIGVQTLLDAIIDYLPSCRRGSYQKMLRPLAIPSHSSSSKLLRPRLAPSPPSASIVARSNQISMFIMCRRMQMNVLVRLIIPRGKLQETAPRFHAGDIGAVAKLTNTHTGDTLVGSKE